MIIDHIDNVTKYESLLPNLAKGLEAIRALGEAPALGRYEFDGGYFMVQEGVTKPISEGSFEAHRKYMDVQILTEGCEEVAWEDVRGLSVVTSYSPEKDIEFLQGEQKHVMKISKGMFYVAFPQDAHHPGTHTQAQHHFRKIVLKLPVENV